MLQYKIPPYFKSNKARCILSNIHLRLLEQKYEGYIICVHSRKERRLELGQGEKHRESTLNCSPLLGYDEVGDDPASEHLFLYLLGSEYASLPLASYRIYKSKTLMIAYILKLLSTVNNYRVL